MPVMLVGPAALVQQPAMPVQQPAMLVQQPEMPAQQSAMLVQQPAMLVPQPAMPVQPVTLAMPESERDCPWPQSSGTAGYAARIARRGYKPCIKGQSRGNRRVGCTITGKFSAISGTAPRYVTLRDAASKAS